jgi:tRNA pseudouridine32 synthase / 23S rRNA pseudouridine746 synthase
MNGGERAHHEREQGSWDAATASRVALPNDVSPWPTLLDFFASRFPHVPREVWQSRFQCGEITYVESQSENFDDHATGGGKPLLQHNISGAREHDAPRAHARLAYFRRVENEIPIPFEESVIYKDDHIVVADKPHFLPVVPSGAFVRETLLARLRMKLNIDALTPIHRIDRETAGLVVFCIRPEERGAYQSMFRDRQVTKTYEAIAPYRESLVRPFVHRSRLVDAEHFMQMKEIEGEANSETQIEMVEQSGTFARYRLVPLTGKRHQLRVHMSALGATILNDRIYPTLLPSEETAPYELPLQLLAKSIAFVDPITCEARRFHSERKLSLDF